MIKIENLRKSYGGEEALKGISFEINDGEVLGFLGPNGAGKSTTMKIITGFMPATSGNVIVNGKSVNDNPEDIQKLIGYLPETTPLYDEMLISEYLFFVGRMRNLSEIYLKERVTKVVELIGLQGNFNKPISHLSKGFKQRVGIAQAILHDPEILILDEPTVGLDPNQIIEIRELIKNIGKKKTVILCSHILSEVQATSDRVVIINNGILVAQGTSEELIQDSSDKVSFITELKSTYPMKELLQDDNHLKIVSEDELSDGWSKVKLSGKESELNGEEIFEMCKSKNIALRELIKEKIDLEQVFTKLTKE